jgi:hypothetical protein
MRDERFVKLIASSTNQPFDTEFLGGRPEVTEVQNPSSQLGLKVQCAACPTEE